MGCFLPCVYKILRILVGQSLLFLTRSLCFLKPIEVQGVWRSRQYSLLSERTQFFVGSLSWATNRKNDFLRFAIWFLLLFHFYHAVSFECNLIFLRLQRSPVFFIEAELYILFLFLFRKSYILIREISLLGCILNGLRFISPGFLNASYWLVHFCWSRFGLCERKSSFKVFPGDETDKITNLWLSYHL
jgi:hypothetical protein